MMFFTSDLHLGHRNIIRLCNRPFATIEEMDEALIRNWNAKVTNGDTIYILGDLIFRNEKPAEEYLTRLNGKKHLIIGNHDRGWVKKCKLEDYFESVNNLHFISDGKRQMTLCHYPMMTWPHVTRCYMVFGHIHGNTDAEYWPLIQANSLMLNAGVDINGFAPVTFEELEANNIRHKAESGLEVDS
ncbi:metallophosphoesterase [Neglectibacter caecimuris]|jgi:calcineurin-like phosphoesterase family protein|uniref:metallophosphoesterase n=1 Tax=Neglectibacter caecimuris TaxID=3093658 RepID=UPI002AC91F0F|nr:metallophosphoesterase [Neglectibacter sp. M00184]